MPRNKSKTFTSFSSPPDDDHGGYYRLPEVLERIPVSERTWWRGIRAGRYPRPTKISPNVDGWRKRSIHQLCEELDAREG